MDLETSYNGFLSSVFALAIAILFLALLFTIFWYPGEDEVECPSPTGGEETKVVKVPKYPQPASIAFLILIYVLDILILYPCTQDGLENEFHWLYVCAANVGALVHILAAIGWSSIERNWLTAEARYALWFNKYWSCYYWSFILTGIAVGLPIFYKSVWGLFNIILRVVLTMCGAICNAYAPFKAWY